MNIIMKETKKYKLTSLSLEQITAIYNDRMVEDFPSDELKPLNMIYRSIEEGRYDCFGLMENDEIVGYSFLKSLEGHKDYLIDYLATYPNRRNEGLGVIMIRLLAEELTGADSIIGEVENPEYAPDNACAELQTRRLNFYMRSGFRDTGVRVRCFGVQYIIIELGQDASKTEERIKELYRQHYAPVLQNIHF